LYDVVSTAVYPDVEQSMAMAIGEDFDPDALDAGDLIDFAEDCGLNYGRLDAEWRRTATGTLRCAEQVAGLAKAEGWHRRVLDEIVAIAEARAARLT
jgi:serine/threonine-protein kinase HipA